ncbi:hypothetical protein COHCIP112018_02367 [Cohnella sp. JJ-181]|nr:hypothetical protein COHCIP112018_02367 [Cohnella sp. JJ-181]
MRGMRPYYKITIDGRTYGKRFHTRKAVAESAWRLSQAINGVGWKQCR